MEKFMRVQQLLRVITLLDLDYVRSKKNNFYRCKIFYDKHVLWLEPGNRIEITNFST